MSSLSRGSIGYFYSGKTQFNSTFDLKNDIANGIGCRKMTLAVTQLIKHKPFNIYLNGEGDAQMCQIRKNLPFVGQHTKLRSLTRLLILPGVVMHAK